MTDMAREVGDCYLSDATYTKWELFAFVALETYDLIVQSTFK